MNQNMFAASRFHYNSKGSPLVETWACFNSGKHCRQSMVTAKTAWSPSGGTHLELSGRHHCSVTPPRVGRTYYHSILTLWLCESMKNTRSLTPSAHKSVTAFSCEQTIFSSSLQAFCSATVWFGQRSSLHRFRLRCCFYEAVSFAGFVGIGTKL